MKKPKIKYVNRHFKTTPEHMRKLPGELVTHDAADPLKVHKNDPAHTRKTLIKDAAKRLADNVPPITRAQAIIRAHFDKLAEDPFRFDTLDQEVVDLWRARTILAWCKKGKIEDKLYHLWFDSPHGRSCGLKEGPPPPRGDRPKHLRNLNLELQVLDWPARMRDIVKSAGIDVDGALDEIQQRITSQSTHEAARQAAAQAQARFA